MVTPSVAITTSRPPPSPHGRSRVILTAIAGCSLYIWPRGRNSLHYSPQRAFLAFSARILITLRPPLGAASKMPMKIATPQALSAKAAGAPSRFSCQGVTSFQALWSGISMKFKHISSIFINFAWSSRFSGPGFRPGCSRRAWPAHRNPSYPNRPRTNSLRKKSRCQLVAPSRWPKSA